MSEVASAFVTLVPSFKGGQSAISRELDGPVDGASRRSGDRAGRNISTGIGGVVKGAATKIFAPLAAAAGGLAIAGFLKDTVDVASDLQESGTKLEAIFGKAGSAIVDQYAQKGAKGLGQSNLAVKNGAATFGVFGKAAGLAGKDLAGFSTGFVGLATDLASFHNTSPEEAVEAIGSALRGEAEPMRKYGVLLDDASLRQEALRQGLVKTTKNALTPQQKVLAAQGLIYKQTKDAQGDFAKTSGGLANQQRTLAASFEDMKGKIGEKFLPILQKVAAWFIEDGIPAVERFGGWLQDDLWPVLKKGYDTILPGIQEALSILGGGLGDSSTSWKDIAAVITDKVIPILSKAARYWIPYVATQIRVVIEAVKAAWKVFTVWRNIVSNVLGFLIEKIGVVTLGFADMLDGLSDVPGFGWAKDAADKLRGAGLQAQTLGRNISNIDRNVVVEVDIYARTRQSGRITLPDGSKVNVGMREKGGPVKAGHPYIVGEKRPELFVPDTSGTIIPRVPSSGSAGSASGVQQTNHFHGITDPEEAAAAATARLTFALRLP